MDWLDLGRRLTARGLHSTLNLIPLGRAGPCADIGQPTVRRGDPFLLAFVLVGQATETADLLVIDEMIQKPDDLLSNIALGLVEGLQAAARTAEVVEFEVLAPPDVGARSAAARTRVASGADIFEARVAIAERDGIVGLVLQIARLDAVVDLLNAEALLRTIVEAEIPRG